MSTRCRTSRGGFTFRDLLGVAAILGLLLLIVTMLMPGRHRGEPAWRAKCGSNLRQIGQAMRQYALDNNGQFPRTTFDPEDPTPRYFTGWEASEPFSAQGPEPNDVTAAVWLVLRGTDLVAENFICPEDEQASALIYADYGKANKHGMSNFPGRTHLSYSFANPYPSREAAAEGWEWTNQLPQTFAIAADMNPGGEQLMALTTAARTEEMRAGNSPNHNREGQSVLYADGSVRFAQTPFASADDDNIYTAGMPPAAPPDAYAESRSVAIVSPPLTKLDSVLLPTAESPLRPRIVEGGDDQNGWGLFLALLGLLIGALGAVVILVLWQRRKVRVAKGSGVAR